MLYARSKLLLQKEADLTRSYEIRDIEDFTEDWLREKLQWTKAYTRQKLAHLNLPWVLLPWTFLTENQIMHNFKAVKNAPNFWMANLFSILFLKIKKMWQKAMRFHLIINPFYLLLMIQFNQKWKCNHTRQVSGSRNKILCQ